MNLNNKQIKTININSVTSGKTTWVWAWHSSAQACFLSFKHWSLSQYMLLYGCRQISCLCRVTETIYYDEWSLFNFPVYSCLIISTKNAWKQDFYIISCLKAAVSRPFEWYYKLSILKQTGRKWVCQSDKRFSKQIQTVWHIVFGN